jgi:hypothetical protein
MSVIDATRRPLDLSGGGMALSQSAPPTMIELEMQRQCHSNWCWAAVAASVAAYYGQGRGMSQCEIAKLDLGRSDCCEYDCDAKGVECNVTNVFASPLNRVGCLDRLARFKQATPSEVFEELGADRPICVRTVWPHGGAHFLAIVGCWYDSGDALMLAVADPFWGRSEYSYERFSKHYQLLGGRWNDTYYTKAPTDFRATEHRDPRNAHQTD